VNCREAKITRLDLVLERGFGVLEGGQYDYILEPDSGRKDLAVRTSAMEEEGLNE
jgi:hypothetical protein